MNITITQYIPAQPGETAAVEKQGDTLTINGETFDFSPIPDGATLPWEAIGSNYFVGGVDRIDGVLHVALHLPSGSGKYGPFEFNGPADGPLELPQ